MNLFTYAMSTKIVLHNIQFVKSISPTCFGTRVSSSGSGQRNNNSTH